MKEARSHSQAPARAVRSFDCVDAFAEGVSDWMPRVHLLEGGPFGAELSRLEAGAVRVLHPRVGRALEVSGALLPGMRSFGLPTTRSTPATWCGAEASEAGVSVYDSSGSFDASTRRGFESFIVSFSEKALARVCEERQLDIPPAVCRVVACDRVLLEGVRRRLGELEVAAIARPGGPAGRLLAEELEWDLPGRLVEALTGARVRDDRAHVRARVMARAEAAMAEREAELLSVGDLCRITRASERTLRRAFAERYGIGPKAYLLARRLNRVRAGLRKADPATTRVADVANAWGFWHMGQLAAEYRKLFGELPSQTLTRPERESARGRAPAAFGS